MAKALFCLEHRHRQLSEVSNVLVQPLPSLTPNFQPHSFSIDNHSSLLPAINSAPFLVWSMQVASSTILSFLSQHLLGETANEEKMMCGLPLWTLVVCFSLSGASAQIDDQPRSGALCP